MIIKEIIELGGKIEEIDSCQKWTHLIANPSRNAILFSAFAAGKWYLFSCSISKT